MNTIIKTVTFYEDDPLPDGWEKFCDVAKIDLNRTIRFNVQYNAGAVVGVLVEALTTAAESELYDFWQMKSSSYGCSCHISPPCGTCTHPGNPEAQKEDSSCWEVIA